jgi:hypothetical protein
MSRPSHWILGFFAVVGGALWWSGVLQDRLVARPAEPVARGEGGAREVSLHRSGSGKPAPLANGNGAGLGSARAIASEVFGLVVDRRGWPVVWAKVKLLGGDESTETDAFGQFRIRGPGAANRMLRIEAPGRHAPLVVRGGVSELALVMQDALPWASEPAAKEPAVAELLVGEGWVRSAAGEPAAGAKVVVRETGASARTDASGRYVVSLPAGPFSVVAWDDANGVAATESAAAPRRQGKLPLPDLRLAKGHVVRGRLRDADGQDLVGAPIVVDNLDVIRTVRSEQGGLFAVPALLSGELTITVLPHQGHLGRRIPAIVEGDADLGDVAVARAEREPLRLQVVDLGGAAQPFVHVVADQVDGLCRAYGQSDARGVVVLAGLGALGGEGQATSFEVRDPDLRPMQVAAFDAQARMLRVAP